MPPVKRLHDAIGEIHAGVAAMLDAEKADPQGLIAAVESIVRGDRARPIPDPPSVWVFLDAAINEHPPRTMHETWRQPVILAVVTKSDEPEVGYTEAFDLCARARSTVLKRWRAYVDANAMPYVRDVRSVRFEPDDGEHSEKNLYSSSAVLDFYFTIREEF